VASRITFEIVIGAILTQNTNWKNVEKAIKTLKNNNMLYPEIIYNIDLEVLKIQLNQ